jgi:hypothetical protein
MRTHGLLATLSATLLTSFVAAQPAQPDRVVPLNIMWQNHPPTSVVPADPLFVSMVGVQIHVPRQFPDPVSHSGPPTAFNTIVLAFSGG